MIKLKPIVSEQTSPKEPGVKEIKQEAWENWNSQARKKGLGLLVVNRVIYNFLKVWFFFTIFCLIAFVLAILSNLGEIKDFIINNWDSLKPLFTK